MGRWIRPEGYRERVHNIVYRTTVKVGGEEYYYVGKHSTNVLDARYVVGMPEITRNSSQNFHKNSMWVHLGAESKLISKDDLEKYLQQGYEKGRKIGTGKKVWITNGV